MPDVAIVGAGVVGRTLGYALRRAGYAVVAVASRSLASAEAAVAFIGAGAACDRPAEAAARADVVLLTTPDDALERTCEAIAAARGFRAGARVLHTSGVLSSGVLESAHAIAAFVASLHPLQTFASPAEAVQALAGTRWFYEGDEAALETTRELITALEGIPVRIETERKPLYHAGAVLASNYLVTLAARACALLESAGVPAEGSLPAILPLLRGTVTNLERVGLPRALTGPIARGDVKTVELHLRTIAEHRPEDLELYRLLGGKTIPLAVAKGGLEPGRAAVLRQVLFGAEGRSPAPPENAPRRATLAENGSST
ncbi:MAG: DUF2520 domain-containing protein [Planctomycetes bacterium]|nr:DUF2520 domain-containing protein [Planctomycetota bacterium]